MTARNTTDATHGRQVVDISDQMLMAVKEMEW